jgi:hypothetical protein
MILYGIYINTMHLDKKQRWYTTRKPKLQLEILACLVLRGKLSKGRAESLLKNRTHADIINAFNKLELEGRIKKLGYEPYTRGRKQYYYVITYRGLELLITDNPHPIKFWKILFGYCHHMGLASEKVEGFYDLFKERFLKYRNHSFSFQLEIFDNMSDKWLIEMILTGNTLNLEQKIIEILAINPGITFEELFKKTGTESKSDVNKCLSMYTLESYKPLNDRTVYLYQESIGKRHNKKYWDLLLHSVIIVKQNKDNIKTYELSLFGVVLALVLIRYHDRGLLKHGLYYTIFLFSDYYDKIANNYQHKLPLIFGKWSLLKKTLRSYSAYNFDVILDKEIRTRELDKFSINRGGNKELYDAINEIVHRSRQQHIEIAKAGRTVWPEEIPGIPSEYWISKGQKGDYLMENGIDFKTQVPSPEKLVSVRKKLYEILLSLNPIEYGYFNSGVNPDTAISVPSLLERSFSEEITAHYFFHLYFDYEFSARFSSPMTYFSSVKASNRLPVSLRPKDCLFSILKNDKDNVNSVGEWFYRWMQDICNLNKETTETLFSITREIGER